MNRVITRFSPSPNGPLHIGHIYNCLVNEHFAHSHDGLFFVRFDDLGQNVTIEMNDAQRERIPHIIREQRKIIEWMSIPVNGWSIDSEQMDDVLAEIEQHSLLPTTDPYPHDLPVYVRMVGTGWLPYPYTPTLTAYRVVLDHMQKVTHIIRGEEFASEVSLYLHYCDWFGYSHPHFIFLPRLMGMNGDISKSNGGYTIGEMYTAGYSSQDIRDLLAKACLNYLGDDWSLWNLRANPRINL